MTERTRNDAFDLPIRSFRHFSGAADPFFILVQP